MSKRKIILIFVLCVSIAVYAVQAMSRTADSNRTRKSSNASRLRNISEAERKREAAKRRMQRELRRKELAKEGRGLIDREKRRKESQKKLTEERKMRKEFLIEKSALGVTEEQWKVIKAKLEKVRNLREQATSAVGAFIAGGSNDKPAFQWKRPWKDKAPSELTEAQKLAKELIVLVEKKNTSNESFRNKIAALRKARSKEAKLEQQLAEAQKELREILTTRQEAALVLMGRL